MDTGDSSFWRINWISDCEFTCSYISETQLKSKEELDFYMNSTLKFTVTGVSKTYYTYDALVNYTNGSAKFSDTVWFSDKR
ncbi:MAG TPA: hypothetical protein VMZ69_02405, partial [Saprospiraceae bacterium]|nr:hypothetical protein [Saprospiraceae bacterium]